MSQYDLSRKKYSSLAIAAICTVLQDAHEDLHQSNHCFNSDEAAFHLQDGGQVSDMQVVRDSFLIGCRQKFGE